MSRQLADTDYYTSRGGIVPVRWTAPEAIFYHKYSTATDVWSYGCLLYEIWTLGMRPYEGIDTSKVEDIRAARVLSRLGFSSSTTFRGRSTTYHMLLCILF